MGLELEAQAQGIDTVLVACGGGGLASGVAAWFGAGSRVVAVETEGTATLAAALAAGAPTQISVSGIAADALGAARIGELPFEILRRHGAASVVVSDADLVEAQQVLWRELRVFVEPSAAAPLAALRTTAYRPTAGERIALVLCGANGDPSTVG